MSTWISKAGLTLALTFGLAACDAPQAGGGLEFLSGGGGGLFEAAAPLEQTDMAGGAVTLVAPSGFCIDRRSVRSNFALMARCDRLGGNPDGSAFEPLALLTATILDKGDASALSEKDVLPDGFKVIDRLNGARSLVLRVDGPPPSQNLNRDHWRGATQVGAYVVGISVYTPADEPPLGPYGRVLLNQSLAATRENSPKPQ